MNNGAVINDVGEQAAQTERLADKMLQQVFALLSRHDIVPNDVQEQMLTSHVRAMATGQSAANRYRKWMPVCSKKFLKIQ